MQLNPAWGLLLSICEGLVLEEELLHNVLERCNNNTNRIINSLINMGFVTWAGCDLLQPQAKSELDIVQGDIHAAKQPKLQNQTSTIPDIRQIKLSQSTVKPKFGNSSPVDKAIEDIKSKKTAIEDFEPIQIVRKDCEWVSLDNRRLYVFKQALKRKHVLEIKVVVHKLTDPHPNQKKHSGETIFDKLLCKYTTRNNTSIHVKEDIPKWLPRRRPRDGWYCYDKHQRKVLTSKQQVP